MTTTLAGSFPVLPTPFRDDGTIDDADFLSVIDFAVAARSDGVVYPGVASEVETLTAEERTRQVRILAGRIAGRIPIIVGASDSDPAAPRVTCSGVSACVPACGLDVTALTFTLDPSSMFHVQRHENGVSPGHTGVSGDNITEISITRRSLTVSVHAHRAVTFRATTSPC